MTWHNEIRCSAYCMYICCFSFSDPLTPNSWQMFCMRVSRAREHFDIEFAQMVPTIKCTHTLHSSMLIDAKLMPNRFISTLFAWSRCKVNLSHFQIRKSPKFRCKSKWLVTIEGGSFWHFANELRGIFNYTYYLGSNRLSDHNIVDARWISSFLEIAEQPKIQRFKWI